METKARATAVDRPNESNEDDIMGCLGFLVYIFTVPPLEVQSQSDAHSAQSHSRAQYECVNVSHVSLLDVSEPH